MGFDGTLLFIMIAITTILVNTMVALAVRGITFIGQNTDNEAWVKTAAAAGQWGWTSNMHKWGYRSTFQKDVHVFGLVILQRILKDFTSDYPIVVFCLITNVISGLMIFAVIQECCNTGAAVVAWALFVGSIWPYQIALAGGHIATATALFLVTVYLMLVGGDLEGYRAIISYLAAGITMGLMLFSSASMRKYFPLLIAAYIMGRSEIVFNMQFPLNQLGDGVSLTSKLVFMAGIFCLVLGITGLLFYKRLMKVIYYQTGPKWINKLVNARDIISLEEYTNRAREIAMPVSFLLLASGLYLAFCLILVNAPYFYIHQIVILIGAGMVAFGLTFPDVKGNLLGYHMFSQAKQKCFVRYMDYFEKIGRPIPPDMRGAGVPWLIRYFPSVVPGHCILSLAYILTVVGLYIWTDSSWTVYALAILMVILSISPVLVGELTKGPQIARSYYPALVGILLWIGYSTNQVSQILGQEGGVIFWLTLTVVILGSVIWSSYVFVKDLLPTRMAATRLSTELQRLGISEFYTYDTVYNDSLVRCLSDRDTSRLKINYIESISEINQGFLVVPNTSSKSFNLEAQTWAIEHGDFDLDPKLNELIASKTISDYSVARFKTMGTSRFWCHESEVTTYRDLILKEITKDDRYKSLAWIVDVTKLRREQLEI